MELSRALDGFLQAKRVEGLSPNTLRNYTKSLERFYEFLRSDPDVAYITADHVRAFLDHLMTTRLPQPGAAYREPKVLSPKTIRNVHTCLSSLWTWAVAEGLAETHIVRAVKVANPKPAAIEPYTETEIRRLLDSLTHSLSWRSSPDTSTEIPLRRQLRDRAVLLFLLDTGVRASELCNLCIGQVDLVRGSATVRGKGRLDSGRGKERRIRFCRSTSRAISRYLLERNALGREDARLFVDRDGIRLDRRVLAKHLKRLGERAQVAKVTVHRFRHTFAITYLRNGGDVYTLQELLGHTSMEMVRRYLKLAQADIDAAHRRASPVANWRL